MLVKDYMTTAVITASPRDGLHQTFTRMRERNVRHMPVLGDGEELVGLISERDVRRPAGTDLPNVARYFALDNRTRVEEVMTKSVVTVRPDDAVRVALRQFVDTRYGALPVVGADGAVVGIISTLDVLRAFQDSLAGAPA